MFHATSQNDSFLFGLKNTHTKPTAITTSSRGELYGSLHSSCFPTVYNHKRAASFCFCTCTPRDLIRWAYTVRFIVTFQSCVGLPTENMRTAGRGEREETRYERDVVERIFTLNTISVQNSLLNCLGDLRFVSK